MVTYRDLELDECERIREIDASQYIARAWRAVDGKRQLVEIHYLDTDFPNGYEQHLRGLKNTMREGGIALGAFCENRLVGFCSVERDFLGVRYKHLLLDQLFVSRELRGSGIGRALFFKAAQAAEMKGAEKLYICAGSAEETIAFYHALGCKEALEVNQELVEEDPRDLQLEFDLAKVRESGTWGHP